MTGNKTWNSCHVPCPSKRQLWSQSRRHQSFTWLSVQVVYLWPSCESRIYASNNLHMQFTPNRCFFLGFNSAFSFISSTKTSYFGSNSIASILDGRYHASACNQWVACRTDRENIYIKRPSIMILIVLISVFLIPINKSIAVSNSYSVVHIIRK